MTAAGIILGMGAYLSPQQAKGKPGDKRADVWAFGRFGQRRDRAATLPAPI
jgi:hypothetical protein